MEQDQLEALKRKLDELDKKVDERQRPLFGSNVWVLIPIVAIIMWGLINIF